jgi:hypothetical protein
MLVAEHSGRHLLVVVRHGQRQVEEHLDGGQHHRGVGRRQPVVQRVHDVVHLLLGAGLEVAHKLQHLALRPLRKVLRGRKHGTLASVAYSPSAWRQLCATCIGKGLKVQSTLIRLSSEYRSVLDSSSFTPPACQPHATSVGEYDRISVTGNRNRCFWLAQSSYLYREPTS